MRLGGAEGGSSDGDHMGPMRLMTGQRLNCYPCRWAVKRQAWRPQQGQEDSD